MSTAQPPDLSQAPQIGVGWQKKAMLAWQVSAGVTGTCVLIAPIWVTEINRSDGFVKWRVPNQPFDIERVAPFAEVHSQLSGALTAAGKLLEPLAVPLPNDLQP